jgi:hypothetical protein
MGFLVQSINKLTHPPVAFVVFLAVADEDVVFVTWENARHISYSSVLKSTGD